MADLIGILGLTLHAAHKVYSVVQKIKDAPDAVRTLGKNASRVKGLLALMLAEPSNASSPLLYSIENSQVTSLVEDATELTTSVVTVLTKVTRQKSDGTHEIRKSRWIFYSGEAEKLSAQFQTFYVSLTAVYVMATS